jgi:glycosyltransferase involved in cell wall biosynthesis
LHPRQAQDGTLIDVAFTFALDTYMDARARGMRYPPDRLVATLTDHQAVDRLLVADPFRSLPRRVGRRIVRREPRYRLDSPKADLYSPFRLRRDIPTDVGSARRMARAYVLRVERAARRSGLRQPLLITTSPFVAGFGSVPWARTVTYYAWDDWASHPGHRSRWPAYEAAYAAISERGVRVCAVTQAIIDRIAPSGPHAVVPNGVDADEWEGQAAAPSWFAELPGPRLLYIGALDSRIDVDVVSRLAAAIPEGSVVLVGPLRDAEHLRPLTQIPNVHFHGDTRREELVAIVRGADVGLVPHRRTPLTEAMSPLKLYEYLAGGLPVVASDLSPVRDFGGRVKLHAAGGDPVPALQEALAAGTASEEERLRFARANSWRERHGQILELALRGV